MSARSFAAGAVLALASALAVGSDQPVYKTFDLAIEHGLVPVGQRVLRVKKGNVVRLRVTSDVAGELQFPSHALDAKVMPGKTASLSFTATSTGRHPLYWRADGAAPAKAGSPNAALATLEVKLH